MRTPMNIEESSDLPLDKISEKERNIIQEETFSRFEEFSLSSECNSKPKNDDFEIETNSDRLSKFISLGAEKKKPKISLKKPRALSETIQEISNSKLRKKACLKMYQILQSSYPSLEKGKTHKIILNLEAKIRNLHPNMKSEYKNYCIDLMKIIKVF